MPKTDSRNKRIAKNTIFLYIRLLVTIIVSLYTSRVFLRALGADDFGIWNVVGGIVAMFSILSGSLSATISRFITFELGKNNFEKLKLIFSSAVFIQFILSFVLIILAESIGLWFLNSKMNIPSERMLAANWVFQFSVLTFCINLVSVPYNAAIVAHEKMTVFAFFSIFEALGKLGIAFSISIAPIDRLIFYGFFLCLLSLIVRLMYGWYCKRNFTECKLRFVLDKNLFKQMFLFAGWNFIGASSVILREHGGNIIINLFCGPAANAAKAIAVQVNSVVSQFVQNFMVAINPQITKSYASGDKEYMMNLVFMGARISFYMIMLLALPIFVNTNFILELWLGDFPEHTSMFIKLILLFTLSESLSNPLITAMLATGNIRNYQLIVGLLQMLNLPVSYLFLHKGFPPETVLQVAIVFSQCCFFARLILLRNMIGLNICMFLKKVYFNVCFVFALSSIISLMMKKYLFISNTFLSFTSQTLITFVISCVVVLFVGCNKTERLFVFSKIVLLKRKVLHQ